MVSVHREEDDWGLRGRGKAKEHGVTIRFILEIRGFKEKK